MFSICVLGGRTSVRRPIKPTPRRIARNAEKQISSGAEYNTCHSSADNSHTPPPLNLISRAPDDGEDIHDRRAYNHTIQPRSIDHSLHSPRRLPPEPVRIRQRLRSRSRPPHSLLSRRLRHRTVRARVLLTGGVSRFIRAGYDARSVVARVRRNRILLLSQVRCSPVLIDRSGRRADGAVAVGSTSRGAPRSRSSRAVRRVSRRPCIKSSY